MAYLKQRFNGDTVNIYELNTTVVIGRHIDCNIVVDDPTVSSQHAQVRNDNGVFVLRDLGSTNGVRIAKEKITETNLVHGMLFILGTHEFEYLEYLPTDLDKTLKIKKSWIPGVYYTE